MSGRWVNVYMYLSTLCMSKDLHKKRSLDEIGLLRLMVRATAKSVAIAYIPPCLELSHRQKPDYLCRTISDNAK